MEEVGMTDLQFKSHLRGIVADLKEVLDKIDKTSNEEAVQKIESMIERFKSDIESP